MDEAKRNVQWYVHDSELYDKKVVETKELFELKDF